MLAACGGGGGDLSSDSTTTTAPTAQSAQRAVVSGKSYSFEIQATGSNLSFGISKPPSAGSASVDSSGVVTYKPKDISTGKVQDSLTVSVSNGGGIVSAVLSIDIYPPQTASKDPLSTYQWHLNNTGLDAFSTVKPTAGVDLNVAAAWAQGVTGKGVIVNVVDSGLEIAHPDLMNNVVTNGSVNFGGGNNPTNNTDTTGDHGTSVAGLIAMVGKAERGPTAIEAIQKHQSAYLMAVGGAAYLVSKAIKHAKVVGFADLGMEAIYEFDVVDMPVTVAVDAGGTSAHITGPAEWSKRIASGEFKGIAVKSQ